MKKMLRNKMDKVCTTSPVSSPRLGESSTIKGEEDNEMNDLGTLSLPSPTRGEGNVEFDD
jgi:hypothetical protein